MFDTQDDIWYELLLSGSRPPATVESKAVVIGNYFYVMGGYALLCDENGKIEYTVDEAYRLLIGDRPPPTAAPTIAPTMVPTRAPSPETTSGGSAAAVSVVTACFALLFLVIV